MLSADLSVVIPTHNRASQLLAKVKWILKEAHTAELIVVVDGSTDGTVSQLGLIRDTRLKVIVNQTPLGPSRARNIGAAHATHPWVALLDDDDFHSENFFTELLRTAEESGAAVVGTAWLHLKPGTDPASGFGNALRGPAGPDLSSPSIVPSTEWRECLWLPNNVLVRRSVLGKIKFHEGYLGNFWREETDFFVSVARAGYRVVVTNRAYSYQYDKPSGGIAKSNRIAYEYWVMRNDIRFMRRHGAWLKNNGYIAGRGSFLWGSFSRRLKPVIAQFKRKIGTQDKSDASRPVRGRSGS